MIKGQTKSYHKLLFVCVFRNSVSNIVGMRVEEDVPAGISLEGVGGSTNFPFPRTSWECASKA